MQKVRRKNTLNIFSKIIQYIYYVFPFVWMMALLVSLAKSFFYLSILERSRYFNSHSLYLLTLILGIALLFYAKSTVNKFYNFIYNISKVLAIAVGFSLLILNYLEETIWPNYVLSTFHIRLAYLGWVFLLLFLFLFIKITSKTMKRKYFSKIIIFGVMWIVISNLLSIVIIFSRQVAFIVRHPNASYDEKMEEKVGKFFYDYTLFVKENTPENSIILIPPFPAYPWIQTGNAAYLRYFLYPRTLLNGGEFTTNYDLKKENIDYVLLAWGEVPVDFDYHVHGWPKFDVEAEKVVYMIGEKDKKEEVGDYVYKKVENKELWGVIKVKK